MSIKPLFADPNLLHLERISSEPDLITIIVKTKSKQALCLQHHSLSAYLHSRYVHRLADLPWLGVAVRAEVHARRLYCRHVECPQRIFCERIPSFVAPYARRTLRRNEALRLIGLAVGGEAFLGSWNEGETIPSDAAGRVQRTLYSRRFSDLSILYSA